MTQHDDNGGNCGCGGNDDGIVIDDGDDDNEDGRAVFRPADAVTLLQRPKLTTSKTCTYFYLNGSLAHRNKHEA